MQSEEFKRLLEELDGSSVKTLVEKNARYSSTSDCLHNFVSGGEIVGGTPAQACWGYMTKHLVALRDMVERNDFSNREDFLEKCQDTINYIRFLWCIGNERNHELVDAINSVGNVNAVSPEELRDIISDDHKPVAYVITKVDDIIFDTVDEAKKVMNELYKIEKEYGEVTIADLCAISDVPTVWADSIFGWNKLPCAVPIHDHKMVRGYYIGLPPSTKLRKNNDKKESN